MRLARTLFLVQLITKCCYALTNDTAPQSGEDISASLAEEKYAVSNKNGVDQNPQQLRVELAKNNPTTLLYKKNEELPLIEPNSDRTFQDVVQKPIDGHGKGPKILSLITLVLIIWL